MHCAMSQMRIEPPVFVQDCKGTEACIHPHIQDVLECQTYSQNDTIGQVKD